MWLSWLRTVGRQLPARWRAAAPLPQQPAPGGQRARALFEELEPRLLYSADSPAAWLSSAMVPSAVVQVVPPVTPSAAIHADVIAAGGAENGQPARRREIVFVDAAVPDIQALIDTLRAQRPADAEIDIVAIRSDADALVQINAVLEGKQGLDAVHIVSHGDAGRLWIGNGVVDESTLLARQHEFGAWQGALSPQADLLLWGCDVAAGAQGEAFIARFAQLTGADVAASTDATGHPLLGGDWLLEARTGEVAAQAALGAPFQAQWAGLLPSYQQFTHYTGQSEISSSAHWGQTFTHTSGSGTYGVNQVSVALKRDAGAPAQNITVELRSSWNGGVLGSATVDSTSLGTSFTMVELGFSDMVLTDGTAYTLRVKSDSPAGGVHVGTNPSGGYAGGTKLDANGAALAGEDLAFRVAAVQRPTVDASSSVATDGVASVNLAHTTSGSNRLMLVSVATDPHGARASAVTYNGVNLSLVGVEEQAGNHSRVEIWSLVAPSTGAHNVVVTMTGTGYNGLAVGVTTYTGVNQSAPLLDFNSASGISTAAAVTVASARNDFVFAAVHSHNGAGVVPGAGQTEYWDVIDSQSNGAASGQPGASSVTSSWTVDNGDWSAAAVSIQAVDQSTVTLTTTAVKDAYIEQSNPNINRGLLGSMVVDRETGDLQRALVQFDLSAIPANAVVVSAALKLEASAIGGALNASAHQLQQSWTETGVTWNESSSGVNWSVVGGAYNAVALDTVSTEAAGQHQWDVTSLAQAWVAGTQPNHGVMLASADGGGNLTVVYNSRDGAAAPVFDIVYFVPNTAPIASNLSAAESYTEDTAQNLAVIVITDPDSADTISATLTLSSSAAGSLNTGTAGGVTSTYNAGTGVWSASGAVGDVNTLLAALTFTPALHYNGNFSIATSVSDGVALAASGSKLMTGTPVNDAAQITTTAGTAAYTENGVPLAVDTGLTVADVDNGNLAGATVTISANFAVGQDVLAFADQNGISGSWNAGTGVLTLSGNASVANYQTALRSVSYLNSSEAPDTALRTIAFDVSDGALSSAQATRDLQVTAVNDAPVLDNSAAMLLTTIARTNTTSAGNTVAQVIGSVGGDRITDADSAALEGVALTATTTGGLGQWQYSLDGGSSWTAVGAVNTNAALLLRDSDRIRFVPNGAGNGQATITFRAWDQSSGSAGTVADASAGGGTQPYSAAFESATINVVESTAGSVAVADAAQTQAGVPVIINVLANDFDPQGDPLSVLEISNSANGSVALTGPGTITYTPSGGFSGSDSFNYIITDGGQGLTNYWKLDGNASDSVGGSNGALIKGPTTVPGVFGQALQFDGVNDHVALPDLSYTNEFTLSFRFRVDDNSGSEIQYFYSHGELPTAGAKDMVHVGLVESGNAAAGQRNHLITTIRDKKDGAGTPQLLVDASALIGDGQWHQYTATVTPGVGTRVYLDGVLRGSLAIGGQAINPTGATLLGSRSDLDPTSFLNAGSRMDTVALFNRALSNTEVADFWSGGSAQAAVTVSVNAVPVVTSSVGSASYTENAAATAVDGGLTVSDANNATLVGASVSISSNYTPGQDQLLFSNQLGITGSWNAATGELTLSGSASVASYQTALRSVSFINNSDNPVTTPRVLSFVVNDGQDPSVTATRNLTVTAVNDAPTATGLNTAETYTEDTPLNLAAIVVSDGDHTSGNATLTLSNAAAGALSTGVSGAVSSTYNAGTGVWSASGALADVNVLLAGVSFTPALNFNASFSIATQVSDGVAAPVTGSKLFTGVPVNDAPTAINLGAAETYTEDMPLNLVAIVVSDVDSASVTATLSLSDAAAGALGTSTSGAVTSSYSAGTGVWSASGALADVNVLLAGVVFTPATNYTAGFAVSTSISDGVAPAITGNKAFVVSLVNDAPTATNLNAAETYVEDTPLNLTDIVVSDVDSASATATLTLSNPGAGSLGTATSGAVTSTYNAGTGVWTASGLIGDVNALLAGLVFTPAPDFNGGFSINTSVDDGVAAAITGSMSFTGTAVNDAPVASNFSAAETYTEDTVLNLADIVVSDVDGSSGTVTLTLSNPTVGLLGTGTSGAVSSSYNPGTGVWTASGAWADINVLLAALSFTPTPDFNGPFSIATSASDGVAAPVIGSKLFTGLPVNDAPTATNLNAAESYTEDQPQDLSDIVISDIDSPAVNATLTLSNPAAGALSTSTSGAVTASYNAATGVWTASGAKADVNNLLAALSFVPAPDFNGAFTLATRVDDGVAAALLGTKSFTGVPVNDAPTAVGLNTPELCTEDTPLNLVDLVISDIDHSTGSATLTLSDPTVGVLSSGSSGAVSASYNAATGVWTASGALVDLNAVLAALSFTPRADFNGSFSIGISVSDGAAAPVTGTRLFTAAAVNDAPTATNLGAGQSYTEDQPLDLTDIVVSDIDSATATATLTLSNAAAGSLSTGVRGAATSTFNAATGVWSASGTLADVNALLAAVVFSPAPDFNADFSIATAVDDGVAAAITGLKPMAGVPVNDAPTASGLDTAEVYVEDSVLDLSNIVVGDIDSPVLTATLTLSDATVGALSTPTAGAVTAQFDAATGFWSASGAPVDVNAVLAAVRFTPALNFNGAFNLATKVSDGVAALGVGSKLFSGVPVNDAPLLAFTGGLLLAEGGLGTLGAAQLQASDVDNSAAQLVYRVVTAPARGNVLLGGAALASGGTFTQADLDAGRVAYRHDSSETTADTLAFSLDDGQATGATGQLPITVQPVNDEVPRITSPVSGVVLTVAENQTAVTRLVATDADLPAQALSFAIAGGADALSFSIDSSTGDLQFTVAADHERPLDVDRDNVYHVDLRVSDGTLSSTYSVAVAVTPENDNTPQITSSGGGSQAVLEVQEGQTAVVTLTAFDADRPAPVLSYSLAGGADAARFAVDPASGALYFTQPPRAIDPRDADRNNVYQVVVQVSDGTLLVQQALRVQVRAALATGQPSTPPTNEAPPAPAPYVGNSVPAEVATSTPVVWSDRPPASSQETEEPVSWLAAPEGRRLSVLRLADGAGSRSASNADAANLAQQLAAEAAAAAAAGTLEGWLLGTDTESLEAALGLPSTEPDMLQVRPGGLSLAALAAQTAARSSTAVPGQLTPTLPIGDEGRADGDEESLIEALATPVVAGGLAFSASLLIWAMRAGGLVAAMMASVPAWRSLDPLPILERDDKPEDDDLPDDFSALSGGDPSVTPAALEADADAGAAPPAPVPRPGTPRQLIEPLEMLR